MTRIFSLTLLALALSTAGCARLDNDSQQLRPLADNGEAAEDGSSNSADNTDVSTDPDQSALAIGTHGCFEVCALVHVADCAQDSANGCDVTQANACKTFCSPAPHCSLVCEPGVRERTCVEAGGQCGSLTAYGLQCPQGYEPEAEAGDCGDGGGCCLPVGEAETCEALGGQCASLTAEGVLCPEGFMPAGVPAQCLDGAGCCLPLDLSSSNAAGEARQLPNCSWVCASDASNL